MFACVPPSGYPLYTIDFYHRSLKRRRKKENCIIYDVDLSFFSALDQSLYDGDVLIVFLFCRLGCFVSSTASVNWTGLFLGGLSRYLRYLSAKF